MHNNNLKIAYYFSNVSLFLYFIINNQYQHNDEKYYSRVSDIFKDNKLIHLSASSLRSMPVYDIIQCKEQLQNRGTRFQ